MGMINDALDKNLEDEMEELLKPFVQEGDFVFDSWRSEKVFDYKKCIKRVVAELVEIKLSYKEKAIAAGKQSILELEDERILSEMQSIANKVDNKI